MASSLPSQSANILVLSKYRTLLKALLERFDSHTLQDYFLPTFREFKDSPTHSSSIITALNNSTDLFKTIRDHDALLSSFGIGTNYETRSHLQKTARRVGLEIPEYEK